MKKIINYLLHWNSTTGSVEKRSLSAHEIALKQVNTRRRSGVSVGTSSPGMTTESTAETSDGRTPDGRAANSGLKADGKVDHDKRARKERKRLARGNAALR